MHWKIYYTVTYPQTKRKIYKAGKKIMDSFGKSIR